MWFSNRFEYSNKGDIKDATKDPRGSDIKDPNKDQRRRDKDPRRVDIKDLREDLRRRQIDNTNKDKPRNKPNTIQEGTLLIYLQKFQEKLTSSI